MVDDYRTQPIEQRCLTRDCVPEGLWVWIPVDGCLASQAYFPREIQGFAVIDDRNFGERRG